jgi:hypothetical protein
VIKVGDLVKPRPEWIKDPNKIPSGVVVRVEPWGRDGAIFVEGSKRAFAAYVFEKGEDA